MTRTDILKTAEQVVCNDRNQQYGKPEDNFGLISDFWESYLKGKYGVGITISKDDVAIMMVLLKVARVATGKPKADNYVDLAGYGACAGEIAVAGITTSGD